MGTSCLHSSPERTILPTGKPGIMDQWHALFPSINAHVVWSMDEKCYQETFNCVCGQKPGGSLLVRVEYCYTRQHVKRLPGAGCSGRKLIH